MQGSAASLRSRCRGASEPNVHRRMPIRRAAIQDVRTARLDPGILSYAVRLAEYTRDHVDVRYGASPRGSIALVRAARAIAATDGRSFVTPDDVKNIAHPVLAHRLVLTADATLARRTAESVVDDVLEDTPAPGNPVRRDLKRSLGVVS